MCFFLSFSDSENICTEIVSEVCQQQSNDQLNVIHILTQEINIVLCSLSCVYKTEKSWMFWNKFEKIKKIIRIRTFAMKQNKIDIKCPKFGEGLPFRCVYKVNGVIWPFHKFYEYITKNINDLKIKLRRKRKILTIFLLTKTFNHFFRKKK